MFINDRTNLQNNNHIADKLFTLGTFTFDLPEMRADYNHKQKIDTKRIPNIINQDSIYHRVKHLLAPIIMNNFQNTLIEKFIRRYHQLKAILFVAINNFIPSKMYGRFVGLSRGLITLFITLIVNVIEKIALVGIRGHSLLKQELSDEFYFILFNSLLFSQLFLSKEIDEYFAIEKELRVQGLSKKVLYIFWTVLVLLLLFSVYSVKIT